MEWRVALLCLNMAGGACTTNTSWWTGDEASDWSTLIILTSNWSLMDRELRLETLSELPPTPEVLITSEDVEGFEPCGKYKPHLEMFSSGRRVFKHESEDFFLYGKNCRMRA